MTEGALSRFIHTDNTLSRELTGRISVDILQLTSIVKLLPTPLILGRKQALEVFNDRDIEDPFVWNGLSIVRKTYFNYMFMNGCDRPKYKTWPVRFKNIWGNFMDLGFKITKRLYTNPLTGDRYYKKGYTYNLNWCADMDKNMYLGPEGCYFTFERDSLRGYQTNCFESLSLGRGLSRYDIMKLLKYDKIIEDSSKTFQMCPLQFILLSMDSLTAELYNLVSKMPEPYKSRCGYLNDLKFSWDFENNFITTYNPQIYADYKNWVAPAFRSHGFNV